MIKQNFLPVFITSVMGVIFISFISVGNEADQVIFENMDEQAKARHYTAVADNYLKGLNEQNLELIMSLYADNATVEDPVGSEIVSGKEAVYKFYSGAVTMDLSLMRTGPVRVAGVEAAFPFQLRMDVDGVPMVTDIIDVFHFNEEGKIVSMRAFWGPSNRRKATE